jgi:hypothetical protein
MERQALDSEKPRATNRKRSCQTGDVCGDCCWWTSYVKLLYLKERVELEKRCGLSSRQEVAWRALGFFCVYTYILARYLIVVILMLFIFEYLYICVKHVYFLLRI